MSGIFAYLKGVLSTCWRGLLSVLARIGRDKLYHYIAGNLVGAFFGISLGMGFWAFVPAFFVGFAKEMLDSWTGGKFDFRDLFATVLGGAVVSLCFIL